MQTINEERDVLLAILLIVTDELITAFTQSTLKHSWHDWRL